MLGLKRGTVQLQPHDPQWRVLAEETIRVLYDVFGDRVVDIQHVGSTAIPGIHAKPIIDIAVGMRDMKVVLPLVGVLEQRGFLYRGEDHPGQHLFVLGSSERRTHHIHVAAWNSEAWNHYICFRDYLGTFPEKARLYDSLKQQLAAQYPDNRKLYTAGKQTLIDRMLAEARAWKESAT